LPAWSGWQEDRDGRQLGERMSTFIQSKADTLANTQEVASYLQDSCHAHLVGIGGAGMNGLASALSWKGVEVSGCDLRRSAVTERLEREGIRIHLGHSEAHLEGVDLLVLSSAIQRGNPEVSAALKRHIPTVGRAEALAALLQGQETFAVCGTHGKTTTTAMFYSILEHAGQSPNLLIGGKMPGDQRYARRGETNTWIVEADESDASFLHLSPSGVVLTNVDTDHLDNYGSLEAIEEAFARFLLLLPENGWAVLNRDCPSSERLLSCYGNVISFGQSSGANVRAEDVRLNGTGSSFHLYVDGHRTGFIRVSVPGKHNVLNALACIAAAQKVGVPFSKVADALAHFRPVSRRLERKGCEKHIVVLDDYAHHPTAIRRAIETARLACEGSLRVVFQPHRYSRTQWLLKEFGRAFGEADEVIVSDIYGAGETPISGIDGKSIVDVIQASGHPVATYLSSLELILERLIGRTRPGDVVLTLGAGDIDGVAEMFLKYLREES